MAKAIKATIETFNKVELIQHEAVKAKTLALARHLVSQFRNSVSGKVSLGFTTGATTEFIAIDLVKNGKPRHSMIWIDYKARTVKCLTYKPNGDWVQRFASNLRELKVHLEEFGVI
jgi:hypothetical protein